MRTVIIYLFSKRVLNLDALDNTGSVRMQALYVAARGRPTSPACKWKSARAQLTASLHCTYIVVASNGNAAKASSRW